MPTNNAVSTTPALQIAWLLSTVGAKAGVKQSWKKSISNVSIPKLCSELGETSVNQNIRYTSCMLHGISLIYKAKVDSFLSELMSLKMKLSTELQFKDFEYRELIWSNSKSNLSTGQERQGSYHDQGFFSDDPNFNLDIDFLSFNSDNNTSVVKRRKLEILQQDAENFPSYTLSDMNAISHSYSISNATIENSMNSNYMDNSFGLNDETLVANSSAVGFVFNESGNIVELNKSIEGTPAAIYEQDFGLDDFDILDKVPEPQEIIDIDQTKNITNDANFHMSNTENQSTLNQSSTFKRARPDLKEHRLVVDDKQKLTINWNKFTEAEIDSREMLSLRKQTQPYLPTDIYREILDETMQHLGKRRLLSRLSSNVLSNALIEIKSWEAKDIALEFSLDRTIEGSANILRDTEIGRDFQESNKLGFRVEEPEELGDDGLHDFSAGPDDSIFGLSFGEFNRSDSRSRTSAPETNEQWFEDSQNSLQNPVEDWTPAIFDEASLGLTAQLLKFYKFLVLRSQGHGVIYEDPYLKLQTTLQPAQTTGFRKVKFSKLIPNLTSGIAICESAVSRPLAASSFASVLILASKDLVSIRSKVTPGEVTSGERIDIVVPG